MQGTKFRPPPMQPAFSETRHLVVWIAALAAILLSPILTTLVVSPETRYLVMSKRLGPSDWHRNQIFKETAPLDILFLGNSRILTAIDHTTLREVVRTPGGPLKSETLAALFNAYDLTYTFLSDFFAHRHAQLVVINYPDSDFPQVDNHPGEKYIRRLGQPNPGLDIKNPSLAVRNYAEMALIGPRLALASIVHPGSITRQGYRATKDYPDLEPTQGSYVVGWGYQKDKGAPRAAFVRYNFSGQPIPGGYDTPGRVGSCRNGFDGPGAHADRIRLSSRNQDTM